MKEHNLGDGDIAYCYVKTMKKFDFEKKKKVYFIGIGGISMSAIATILFKNGFIISGSDSNENDEVKKLKSVGVKVNIGQKKENIEDDLDIVVYSKAIHSDNPEYIAANEKNIKLMSRSEILGEIMANYEKRICVAGTHGKTTTTSLIAKVMYDQKIDPTINVGGVVEYIGGNSYIGDNKNMFIAEACEYTNSFLDFCPNVAVVTNIEEDHLDFFKDLNDIRKSFKKFVNLLPRDGLLVINKKIDNIEEIVEDTDAKVITYGENDTADYYYKNAKYDENHNQIFEVYFRERKLGDAKIKLLGKHNILNFLASTSVLLEQGLEFDEIVKCLKDFQGAKRRLEFKGIINDVIYIDDYAHHPTEIEASLVALNELKHNKIYLVFQPHTFTRTKMLYNDFVKVLSKVENVILGKIYPAREPDKGIISSKDIAKGVKEAENSENVICECFDTFEEISKYIKTVVKSGDLVVSMGAGDIYKVFDIIKNDEY